MLLEQNVSGPLAVTTGVMVGLTLIRKDTCGPVQVFIPEPVCGVTKMEAILAVEFGLVAIKDGIFPFPFDARPIELLLFIQTKFVPGTLPLNTISLVVDPLQKVCSVILLTVGVGFTVIVKVFDCPSQSILLIRFL